MSSMDLGKAKWVGILAEMPDGSMRIIKINHVERVRIDRTATVQVRNYFGAVLAMDEVTEFLISGRDVESHVEGPPSPTLPPLAQKGRPGYARWRRGLHT